MPMSSLSVYVDRVAGDEPSVGALRLLQLLRLSESDVDPVQDAIDVLGAIEPHLHLRDWVTPSVKGVAKSGGMAEPGKRVEAAIRDYIAQSPNASPECRTLFDAAPFPESEEVLGSEEFRGLNVLVAQLPTFAVTDTYRWLRLHWNTEPGFGGDLPGVARRDKAVEHVRALGLEQEEIDAAEDEVCLPDDYFDERSKLDAPGRLSRINEYRQKEGLPPRTS